MSHKRNVIYTIYKHGVLHYSTTNSNSGNRIYEKCVM